MGNAPTKPSAEKVEYLKSNLDAACSEAARLILQADVLFLCTGAGFSADSGLAVYADVAKVPAYAQRNLEYHDICDPRWLRSDPELFWGFWGQCYNDYRDTPPHPGYEIIEGWVEKQFRHSKVAESIRTHLRSQKNGPPEKHTPEKQLEDDGATNGPPEPMDTAGEGSLEPYHVSDFPGAFFVFTSNVDAHHFDWFRACEIRECHGNTELYQCAADWQCCGVWRAPLDFRFCVDKETMLAPTQTSDGTPAALPQEAAPAAGGADLPACEEMTSSQGGAPPEEGAAQEAAASTPPRIGHVKGGGRNTMLRHMPGGEVAGPKGFEGNHPTCRSCGAPARPAILMFGDMAWQDVDAQEERFGAWSNAVSEQLARSRLEPAGKRLRILVLEIGAGGNVTTVRNMSERMLQMFRQDGALAKLVRVNPDLPLGDGERFRSGGSDEDAVISVMARGLESLKRIDAAVQAQSTADGA